MGRLAPRNQSWYGVLTPIINPARQLTSAWTLHVVLVVIIERIFSVRMSSLMIKDMPSSVILEYHDISLKSIKWSSLRSHSKRFQPFIQ